jgi:hypothetical protein
MEDTTLSDTATYSDITTPRRMTELRRRTCYLVRQGASVFVLHAGQNDEPLAEVFDDLETAVLWAHTSALRIVGMV